MIIEQQKEKISNLENTIKDLKGKQTIIGLRLRAKILKKIEQLKRVSGGCNKRIKAIR